MSCPTELTDLGKEDFVLLTTYRRNGDPVGTPVWIAPLNDALVVSTPEGTGKLKRLWHTSRITLQACSRRGKSHRDAPVVVAQAAVSRDPSVRTEAEKALAKKYGWQWRVVLTIERLIRGGKIDARVILLITGPADSAPSS